VGEGGGRYVRGRKGKGRNERERKQWERKRNIGANYQQRINV